MIGLPVDPHEFDGMSLARALTQTDPPDLRARVRFMETGLYDQQPGLGQHGRGGANLREGTEFFRVDRTSGRVVPNVRRLPDLIARKQRAALDSAEWMLATIPQPGTARQHYVFIRRSGGALGDRHRRTGRSERSTIRRPVAGIAATVRRRSSPHR